MSEQTTGDKPGKQKAAISVTSRKNTALARRLAPGGNPFGQGSRALPLKEPKRWHLYIANNYGEEDFLYRMRHEYGWEPLEPSDLACKPEEVGFRVSEDGNLVRGPQGREMVFKMPVEDYHELVKRKTERNNATIGKPGQVKADTANAAASQFGPEAGDYVEKHFHGTVTDTLEPLP